MPNNKYINTALNFTGSKYQLLEQILPEMDYTKKYFVDLFAGSGVVGFNVADKYEKILINDIIDDLIGIHKEIMYNSLEFIEDVKKLVVSKDDQEGFNKLRSSYNNYKNPQKLYALLLCSTNNMMRFNKNFQYNQTFGKRTFSENTQKKLNAFIDYIKPYSKKFIFSTENFSKIKITKPSMIYIDPPYGSTQDINGNITKKKISEAGYNCYFDSNDDIELYNYIHKLNDNKHSFMISGLLEHNNLNSWIMNKLILDGFKYKELNFNYNNISHKGEKKSKEIIILNY